MDTLFRPVSTEAFHNDSCLSAVVWVVSLLPSERCVKTQIAAVWEAASRKDSLRVEASKGGELQ